MGLNLFIMRSQSDAELNTELQELYLTGKQWLSDVDFITDEQRFLNSLLNPPNYFAAPDAGPIFADDLVRTEEKQQQLHFHIVSFMTRLEPLICETRPDLDIQLIEDFAALQTEVSEALGRLKTLKYRMIERKTSIEHWNQQ